MTVSKSDGITLEIRAAVPEDASDIARLANALAKYSEADDAAMTAEKVREHLLPSDSGFHLLVAVIEARVIGYALHHIAYETSAGAVGQYLADLFVDPDFRRCGAATALVWEVARRTEELGGEFIWWVEKNNAPAAQALYGKLANISIKVTAYAATEAAFTALSADNRSISAAAPV